MRKPGVGRIGRRTRLAGCGNRRRDDRDQGSTERPGIALVVGRYNGAPRGAGVTRAWSAALKRV